MFLLLHMGYDAYMDKISKEKGKITIPYKQSSIANKMMKDMDK